MKDASFIYDNLSASEKRCYTALKQTGGDIVAASQNNLAHLDRLLYNPDEDISALNQPLTETEERFLTESIEQLPLYFGHSSQYPRSVFAANELQSSELVRKKAPHAVHGMTKTSDSMFGNKGFVFGTLFAEADEERITLHRGDFFFNADSIMEKGCITFHDGFTVHNASRLSINPAINKTLGNTVRSELHDSGKTFYSFKPANGEGEETRIEMSFKNEYFFAPHIKEAIGKMCILHLRHCDEEYKQSVLTANTDELAEYLNNLFPEIEIKVPERVPFEGNYIGCKRNIERMRGQSPSIDRRIAEENSYYSVGYY